MSVSPRALYELREYRLRTARAPEYLHNFDGRIAPLLVEYGFDIRGKWIAEGDDPTVTTFVWLIAWRDRAQREAAFARLTAWEGWADYLQSVAGVVIEARSRLLSPTTAP